MRCSVHLPYTWLICLGLAAASLAPSAKELSTKGVLLDKVVAVVNDGVVLESELDLETREIEARLQTQHVFTTPGTYFVALRAGVHRDGAAGKGLPTHNLDRARVVVV